MFHNVHIFQDFLKIFFSWLFFVLQKQSEWISFSSFVPTKLNTYHENDWWNQLILKYQMRPLFAFLKWSRHECVWRHRIFEAFDSAVLTNIARIFSKHRKDLNFNSFLCLLKIFNCWSIILQSQTIGVLSLWQIILPRLSRELQSQNRSFNCHLKF